MKVHSVNTNYHGLYNSYAAKRENTLPSAKKEVSYDAVMNYLRISGVYNCTFGNAVKSFYAISADGTYRKFNERKTAEAELSLAKSNIAECLQGKRAQTHGYGFCYASDIEVNNENGETVIDEEKLSAKISEIRSAVDAKGAPVSIYAIDENGRYKKYPSMYRAEKDTGVSTPHIISCLNGELRKSGGYTFVKKEDFEIKDENGKTNIDYNVLKEKISILNENAIYAVRSDGTYTKYASQADAARELGVAANNISECINGIRRSIGKCFFVKAEDIELFSQGYVSINKSLLGKLTAELAAAKGPKAVYLFDSKGKYQRYDSVRYLVDNLSFNKTCVMHCLSGKYKTYKGYRIFYAEQFETFDEKGNIAVDRDKLYETSQIVNPDLKKLEKKYGKIYALRGVNVYEFDNLHKAAIELDIDEDAIIYFLNHGWNSGDGKNSINGYVFTCEKDE